MGIEIGPPKRTPERYSFEEEAFSQKLVEFPIIREVRRKIEHNLWVLRRILTVG